MILGKGCPLRFACGRGVKREMGKSCEHRVIEAFVVSRLLWLMTKGHVSMCDAALLEHIKVLGSQVPSVDTMNSIGRMASN